MSDRINEAINALRDAGEVSSAHEALKTLRKLLEDLNLEDTQVSELQGELAEVQSQVAELQLALNTAQGDLDQFKEAHGFWDRAFGPERKQWAEMRKAIKARAADLAKGRALEIGLTLILEEAASGEGRPTGLRASEWKTRVEAAAKEGAQALADVLIALRKESESDSQLVNGLEEALGLHRRLMRRAKLRQLVRIMKRGVSSASKDVDLQIALYNDALVTLRTLVEAEARSAEGRFADETAAAEWLADVPPHLDEVVAAVQAAQKATDEVELAIPALEQAQRQLDEAETKLANLEDELRRLDHGGGPIRFNPRDVSRFAGLLETARVGAPLAGGSVSPLAAAGIDRRLAFNTISPAIVAPAAASSSASAPASAPVATPVASASAVSSIRTINPAVLGAMAGHPGMRIPSTPGVGATPPPAADPKEAQRKQLQAEIATVKDLLNDRRGAQQRAQGEVQRKRQALSRTLATLDHAIVKLHQYLGTWPMFQSMPVPVVSALPVFDLGGGVGLAGPQGGLLPATVGLSQTANVQQLAAYDELYTSLLAEIRAMGESVSTELKSLTASTDEVIDMRMAELLGGSADPLSDRD